MLVNSHPNLCYIVQIRVNPKAGYRYNEGEVVKYSSHF